eukprot:s3269_g5.t1
MTRSPAPPIPKDQLLDDRETPIEYQDVKKVLHKDNWEAEKKRCFDNLDGYWKSKTVYKIKDGTGLGLVTRLVAAGAASFCVAGVALGDMELHFVWQAWRLATCTFTLCGRRGTCGTGLGLVTRLVAAGAASFCVAGVALGDMELRVLWQAWHLRHSAGSGDALGCRGRRLVLRGRRGTWCCMDFRFVWQAWHLATSTFTLCVAGVALTALGWVWGRAWLPGAPHHSAWQAWRLVTWSFVFCGRRGAWRMSILNEICGQLDRTLTVRQTVSTA